MTLAEFTRNNRAQTTGQNNLQEINSYLSGGGTNETEDFLRKCGRKVWNETDMVEKVGGVMAGPVSVPVIASPSKASEMNELLSEKLPLGEHESDVHSFMEDLYEFKDQYLIGYPRNAEDPISKVTLNADKVGHYSVGYLSGGLITKGIDKFTDEYDPKKVAIGGALGVATYAVAKEGAIEGGEGIQFNLDNMDVWGDWAMDTLGMTHSIYNFHKRKTAENGEEPKGVLEEIANKAGRIYGKASIKSENSHQYLDHNSRTEDRYLTGNPEKNEGDIASGLLDKVNRLMETNDSLDLPNVDERGLNYINRDTNQVYEESNSSSYTRKISEGLEGMRTSLTSIFNDDEKDSMESMESVYS